MLHLVLDTNTALSGLLWGGTPKRLIMAARAAEVTLFCSVPLLEELGGVIHRKKFTQPLTARGLKAEELFNGYAALCRIVEPLQIQRTSIDPDDDAVLATALAAPADLIVSGDAKAIKGVRALHSSVLRDFSGTCIADSNQNRARALDRRLKEIIEDYKVKP